MVYFEVLAAISLGIISGIITGLIPGIHVNLVSVLMISFSAVLLDLVSPLILAVYIISLAITHTFLDAIPSIYLGAPDEAQALNVLPGHRLLNKGEGHNAITYTIIGSLGSLLLGIILFPVFIITMKVIYPILKNFIGYFLIIIILFMVLTGLPNLKQPLFPLLSGLFGFSILVVSFLQKSKIPPQIEKPLTISNKNMVKSVSAATGVGFMAAFLPGFGSSQAAIVATSLVGDIGDEGFLTLVGGINTANMLISIAAVYILDKARNGAIVAVKEFVDVGLSEVLLFLGVALVVGGMASVISLKLSKYFSKLIVKVNYQYLVASIILFIRSISALNNSY